MAGKRKRVHPNAVQFTVVSCPRALDFYKEKLGFKLVDCFPNRDKPIWATMVRDGQAVVLYELPSLVEAREQGFDHEDIELLKQDARAFARGTPGAGVVYHVQVKNVDALARRLKQKRVRLLTTPKSRGSHRREVQVADLDGYRLVFFTPDAPQSPASTPAPAGGPPPETPADS